MHLLKFVILIYSLSIGTGFADTKRAKAMASQGKYEEAANEYYVSYSNAKSKVEKRRAEWGLAQSLQKLGLLYSSSKFYSVIVRRGRRGSNPFFAVLWKNSVISTLS